MATRTIPELTDSDKERFWEKIDKDGPIIREELGQCWKWLASTNAGYGAFGIKTGVYPAQRISWTIAFGPIPEGLHVLHKCDNPPCCNPDHLFTGTHKNNMEDMTKKKRNGLTLHPESVPRGDRSGPRLHPERMERGETRYNAKMTEAGVREIRVRKLAGESSRYLAVAFGICHSTAKRIISKKAWAHVP